METFLRTFLPRVLPAAAVWRIIDHGSKWQLLRSLPDRLKGYANVPEAYRPKTLVLIDRDDDDCLLLKQRLDEIVRDAGLVNRTDAQGGPFDVINRIVVEELEAWFFGDNIALTQSWPRVPITLESRQRFRDPDAIAGGTHEALLSVLQKAGYWRGVPKLPKSETARRMAALMHPAQNRSRSFHQFMAGLEALVAFA